jgi:hypothetical protein
MTDETMIPIPNETLEAMEARVRQHLADASESVIEAAECFVRVLAAEADLSSKRDRRRLRLALEELGRIRAIFAEGEEAEADELPEGAEILAEREQGPDPVETTSQRLQRELISALPDLIRTYTGASAQGEVRLRAQRAEAVVGLTVQIRLAEAQGDEETAEALRAELRALRDGVPPGPPPSRALPVPEKPPYPGAELLVFLAAQIPFQTIEGLRWECMRMRGGGSVDVIAPRASGAERALATGIPATLLRLHTRWRFPDGATSGAAFDPLFPEEPGGPSMSYTALRDLAYLTRARLVREGKLPAEFKFLEEQPEPPAPLAAEPPPPPAPHPADPQVEAQMDELFSLHIEGIGGAL